MMLSHTLTTEQCQTLSLNFGHGDRYARNTVVRQVRTDVEWLAQGTAPVDTPATVDVVLWQRTNRRRDPDNVMPLAKPILDGLVAAGVLPDDSHRHVAWVRYAVGKDPDVKSGTVRVDVTVEPTQEPIDRSRT